MPFFDTHCHLDLLVERSGKSIQQILHESEQAGVKKILTVATKVANFESTKTIANSAPQAISYGLGIHPWYVTENSLADLDVLESHLQAQDPNCKAVAEIGLDRALEQFTEVSVWQQQYDFLIAQLALAKKYHLPVSLHSRRTHEYLYPILKQANLSKAGVIHAFSGSYTQAKRFIDLGYKIGVGSTITYQRASKTRNTIKRLPLDALVLETDSPDMPLANTDNAINYPANISLIFAELCSLRSEEPDEIARVIWGESCGLFE